MTSVREVILVGGPADGEITKTTCSKICYPVLTDHGIGWVTYQLKRVSSYGEEHWEGYLIKDNE